VNFTIWFVISGGIGMAKLIMMYEKPKDIEGFENHYFNVHVPLGRKMPYIMKESIQRVVHSQNTELQLYLIVELEFESVDAIHQSLASPEARACEEDALHLFQYLHKPPMITIVE
jgi:uncharacterized protein (TIGR02118 family)